MAEEASAELIEQAKRDRAAFGRLYDIYVHRIYGFALVQTKSREVAEDLTAQAFERALSSIGRYQARGAPFSSWLYRIAANLVIDRGRRARGVVLLGDESLPETGSSEEAGPPHLVEQWERANWLLDHVQHLPAEQQQAVQLRFWGERSFAEIADVMGRSEEAAKQLVYRAIRGLRIQIEREAQSNV